MIDNDQQLKITRSLVKKFEKAVKKVKGTDAMSALQREGLLSQLQDLKKQIRDYTNQ